MRQLDGRIALLSASGRFPGVEGIDGLGQASVEGRSLIRRFSRQEMLDDGAPAHDVDAPNYVPVKGWLSGSDLFDAQAFGISPADAAAIDPQQRIFLEECACALDLAAIDPVRFDGRIAVFAGQFISTYLFRNLASHMGGSTDAVTLATMFQGNTVDQLAARVAYRLDLRGPAITVQTACSSSLVAVHMACASLLAGECDVAIAGGVAVSFPSRSGYFYVEGGIHSRVGACRPFDAAADGTVFGDGVGVVVLRRAAEAIETGDPIRAIILATAINNDGARKVGHSAPSVDGQKSVLAEALEMADARPETIGYLETHGTGTPVGDLVEMTAIKAVYLHAGERPPLVIGAVKANTGHLEAAAGIAGLIRAVQVVERGVIPPIAGLQTVNPLLETDGLPIAFPTAPTAWPLDRAPRRAAVSAFGVGGTNAHVIIEQRPSMLRRSHRDDVPRLIPISGTSPTAVQLNTAALAAAVRSAAAPSLAEVQKTLALGRPQGPYRAAVVAEPCGDLAAALAGAPVQEAAFNSRVVLVIPGQGTLVPGAARALYEADFVFRAQLDEIAELLLDRWRTDVRALLFNADTDDLHDTANAHPAGFALSYALASWLDALAVPVASMVGHSLGEFVAAARAGVLSLEEALGLIVARGKLIAGLPQGGMMTVMLAAAELTSVLDPERHGLDIACQNGSAQTVLAGSFDALVIARKRLHDLGVACVDLPVSHAFHSRMMAPADKPWRDLLNGVHFAPPRSSYFSSVSGLAAEAADVCTPDYWVEHLLKPVRFQDALRAAVTVEPATTRVALVELGPASALTQQAERWLRAEGVDAHAVGLLGGRRREPHANGALAALGRLWCLGVPIAWEKLVDTAASRVSLPPRQFEAVRHFIDAASPRAASVSEAGVMDGELKRPVYRTVDLGRPRISERQRRWLIVAPSQESVAALGEHLLDCGQVVSIVVSGPAKERIRRGVYRLPMLDAALWLEFLRELKSLVRTPNVIVHALALDPDVTAPDGVRSLGALAEAWMRESTSDLVQLAIVAPAARPVLGIEQVDPRAAGLAAAARVLGQEVPRLETCFIDLPSAPDGAPYRIDARNAEMVTEIMLDETSDAFSIRGRRVFRREFEPLELPADAACPYRAGGVYVITGGSGGLGRLLADDLVRRFSAKVIVVSRNLAGHEAADASAGSGGQRRSGARVIPMVGDVTDPEAMDSVLLRVRRAHGEINGIIHAAGVVDGQLMTAADTAHCEAVFAPKARGLEIIADCIRRLGPWPELDFVVAFSSTAVIIGGPGQGAYAAANAAMDALALNLGRDAPKRWVTVLWDTVRGTGMAVRGESAGASPLAGIRDAYALDPLHCPLLLERALGSPATEVVISRVASADLGVVHRRIKEALDSEVARSERPQLKTVYSAPRNELEQRLAEVWGRVLGLHQIGIHDRFTELGGHSLLAAQLRGEIKKTFDIQLPVSSIFAADTVAAMAATIEAAIMAELQAADAEG